jgi:hypothetical protein
MLNARQEEHMAKQLVRSLLYARVCFNGHCRATQNHWEIQQKQTLFRTTAKVQCFACLGFQCYRCSKTWDEFHYTPASGNCDSVDDFVRGIDARLLKSLSPSREGFGIRDDTYIISNDPPKESSDAPRGRSESTMNNIVTRGSINSSHSKKLWQGGDKYRTR